MKKILILVGIILVLNSCTINKEIGKSYNVENNSSIPYPIVDTNFNSNLYKVGIHIQDRYFSGLMLIRKMDDTKALRIVLLSEVGLNLMDLQLKDGKFKVINCQDYLNNSILINQIKNDLKTILYSETDLNNITRSNSKIGDSYILTSKKRSEKYYYIYSSEGTLTKLLKTNGIFQKTLVEIHKYENNTPMLFEIRHGNYLKIKFNLLKRER